jgi:hypothetical protein
VVPHVPDKEQGAPGQDQLGRLGGLGLLLLDGQDPGEAGFRLRLRSGVGDRSRRVGRLDAGLRRGLGLALQGRVGLLLR